MDIRGIKWGQLVQSQTTDVPLQQGTFSFPVSAGDMWPRTTNGCASLTQVEAATNKNNYKVLDFDAAAIEYAQFIVTGMPKSWNEGTITAVFEWTAASGSGDVVWALQAIAYSNDDAIDTAFGTAQTATDTLLTAGDFHRTSATSAITVGGSPAAEDGVLFQIYRNATDGGDTLAVDARLIGLTIYLTINAANDG